MNYNALYRREDCLMRHENGNCLPNGGFCLSISNHMCDALHQAYDHGFSDGNKTSCKCSHGSCSCKNHNEE